MGHQMLTAWGVSRDDLGGARERLHDLAAGYGSGSSSGDEEE